MQQQIRNLTEKNDQLILKNDQIRMQADQFENKLTLDEQRTK